MNPFSSTTAEKLLKLSEQASSSSEPLKSLESSQPHFFEECDCLFDFSRQNISQKTLDLLFEFAEERGLKKSIDGMFSGKNINNTEDRQVLHVALRNTVNNKVITGEGKTVLPEVSRVLQKMTQFSDRIHLGSWTGFHGDKITDVVNIGIGGSDLGPKLITETLQGFKQPDINVHFCSSVDKAELNGTLNSLNPSSTLFVITSKSFTTQETMLNSKAALSWFLNSGATQSDVEKHFVAVSVNINAATKLGIHPDNIFPMWDWVGGRYSVWSAVGLSLMLAIGSKQFVEFLKGASEVDEHFVSAKWQHNIPVLLALISVWNINFRKAQTQAIIPYHYCLHSLPFFCQQLEMESNGKSVGQDGNTLAYDTSPVVWGGCGNNGQHAYFQMLHQGSLVTPIDFIVAVNAKDTDAEFHKALLANLLGHSEVLSQGKSTEAIKQELNQSSKGNLIQEQLDFLGFHKELKGQRPSTLLMMNEISPISIGRLIAMYEHKVFVQGVIWGINSFDQWGVEEGKNRAGRWTDLLNGADVPDHLDPTSKRALEFINKNWTL